MSKIKAFLPGVSSRTGKKDCTVRALANTLGISYIKAHEHMQQYGARTAGTGLFDMQLYNAYTAAGAKRITTFGRGGELRKRYLLEPDLVDFKVVELPTRTSTAIRDIVKTGRHIVSIPGHALAVVDGNIIDLMDCSSNVLVTDVYSFDV